MNQVLMNNAEGTVEVELTAGALTVTVDSALATRIGTEVDFANEFILLTINAANSPSSWEIVKCTDRTGDVLTIERAQEGTSDVTWVVGSKVSSRVTKGTIDRARRQHERLLFDAEGRLLFDDDGNLLIGEEV